MRVSEGCHVLTPDDIEESSALRGMAGVACFAQIASASVVELTAEAVVMPSTAGMSAATAGPHLAEEEPKSKVGERRKGGGGKQR